MPEMKELYQSADWKLEKHVPVIDAPATAKKNEKISISATVGKDIPHPNKTEHHIRWIAIYYLPQGEKYPHQLIRAEFTSHGESVKGPDSSSVYTEPQVTVNFKTEKPGTLLVSSFCNIHGLWQSSQELQVA
jgi:superoxide reductase